MACSYMHDSAVANMQVWSDTSKWVRRKQVVRKLPQVGSNLRNMLAWEALQLGEQTVNG